MKNEKKKPGKVILIIISCLIVLAVVANLVRIAIVYVSLKNGMNAYPYDLAVTNCNRAINYSLWDKGKKADGFFWRGRAYFNKINFELSIADFSEAIELCPDDYAYYLWRGIAYQQIKNYDLAIADINEALRLNHDDIPGVGVIYKEFGDIYSLKEEWDLAVSNYETSLRINPDSINAKEGLEKAKKGQKAAEQKEQFIAQRIESYSDEIRKNPNNADLYFKRGYLYAFNEEFIYSINSSSLELTLQTLILLYISRTEAWDRAISDWKMALKINPNHTLAKEYLKRAKQWSD